MTAFRDKRVLQALNSRLKGGLNADRPVMVSELLDILASITGLSDYLRIDGTVAMTGQLELVGDPVAPLNPVTLQLLEQTIIDILNGAPANLDTLGELASALGNDPNFATTINAEISNIKNYEFKVLYYESINSSSGTITKPANTEIILSDFPSGYDAVVETIVGGEPSGQIARTAGGIPVTVTSFDIAGNYTLSGTPSAYPVAFLYILKVKAQYLSNLTFDNIIETANFNLTSATDLSFIPNGDISATNVQDAIVEVRDDTDTKLGLKQVGYTILTTLGTLTNSAGWLKNDGAGNLSYTTPNKTDVGLGNVDNTSDANKPISTATQIALDTKITLGRAKQINRNF
jgi:hypothetical protein